MRPQRSSAACLAGSSESAPGSAERLPWPDGRRGAQRACHRTPFSAERWHSRLGCAGDNPPPASIRPGLSYGWRVAPHRGGGVALESSFADGCGPSCGVGLRPEYPVAVSQHESPRYHTTHRPRAVRSVHRFGRASQTAPRYHPHYSYSTPWPRSHRCTRRHLDAAYAMSAAWYSRVGALSIRLPHRASTLWHPPLHGALSPVPVAASSPPSPLAEDTASCNQVWAAQGPADRVTTPEGPVSLAMASDTPPATSVCIEWLHLNTGADSLAALCVPLHTRRRDCLLVKPKRQTTPLYQRLVILVPVADPVGCFLPHRLVTLCYWPTQ